MEKHPRGMCKRMVQNNGDRTAFLPCSNQDGQAILQCSGAPAYNDYALPLSESLCARIVEMHDPSMNDPYKQTYAEVSHHIDMVLADDFKLNSDDNLQFAFDGMERDLEEMIASDELHGGDNGRYLYHIDARLLQAYLPAFHHRAKHGEIDNIPEEVMENIYAKVCALLADFDKSMYRGKATQVALKRTEIEMFALLLRARRPEYMPWPALFREEASLTHEYNHDAYVLRASGSDKIPIQIKNNDYRTRNGKRTSNTYHSSLAVLIHQQVVNLDSQDAQQKVTPVSHEPIMIDHERDVDDKYEQWDQPPRYVAWGATAISAAGMPNDEAFDFDWVQSIGGTRRDSLVASILKEARGENISIQERNSLNGATYYLCALIREQLQRRDTI